MKTKDKIFVLLHTIIFSLLIFFYFGKIWLFFINIVPISLFFIGGKKEDV